MGVKNTGFDLTSVKTTNSTIFLRIEQGKLNEVKVLGKFSPSIIYKHFFSERRRISSWCK